MRGNRVDHLRVLSTMHIKCQKLMSQAYVSIRGWCKAEIYPLVTYTLQRVTCYVRKRIRIGNPKSTVQIYHLSCVVSLLLFIIDECFYHYALLHSRHYFSLSLFTWRHPPRSLPVYTLSRLLCSAQLQVSGKKTAETTL